MPLIRRREPPPPPPPKEPIDPLAHQIHMQGTAHDPKGRLGYAQLLPDGGYEVSIATGPTTRDYVHSGYARSWRQVLDLLPVKPWSTTRGVPQARGRK